MPTRPVRPLLATVALALFAVCPVLAQAPAPGTEPEGRLFLGFDREAELADRQWWEGQVEMVDDGFGGVDVGQLRLVVALQPYRGFEFGGRVGFGTTDTPPGFPDGDGATDVNLWGKFSLGRHGATDLAVGALVDVPTGDDTAGLGFDAFGFGGFLSLRRMQDNALLHADIGFRVQEDGQTLGVELEGRTSAFLGVGAVLPVRPKLDLVVEGRFESERFRGFDEDLRVLGGVDWRVGGAGRLRAAAAVGLTDGSPDAQLILGWATTY